MSGPSRGLLPEEWVHGGFWAWSDAHGKYVSAAFPDGVPGVEPRFGDPPPSPPPPFVPERTPTEEADRILASLAGSTPEQLAYAVLDAGGRATDRKGSLAERRHWSRVHAILHRAARGRRSVLRVQS